MRIGYCQFCPLFGENKKNIKAVERLLEGQRADLIVLPELFLTGYQFKDKKESAQLAETIDGATISWAREFSEKIGTFICGGFVEKQEGKIYNSAFLTGPDFEPVIYRKIHLFGREKECFDSGDGQLEVFDIGHAKVGIMICFDWIFPETMRTLMLKGAQIICHPSNLVMSYCQKAMVTRCLENMVFAVTANRIGVEERIPGQRLLFTGGSQITEPKGGILYRARENYPEVQILEINPEVALLKNINPMNNLILDRRPEKYSAITRRKK